MEEFKTFMIVAINIGLFISVLGMFVGFLWFVYKRMAPTLVSGKVDVKYILSLIAGIAFVLLMIMFFPKMIAEAVQFGFESYMPVMMETAQMVVDAATEIMDGSSPNFVAPQSFDPTPTPAPLGNLHEFGGLGNDAIQNWTPDMPAPTPELGG
ncbi:MAG: hypothetical protein CSB13_06625 [Chloroflexi bacterium]|nr:MAG: hypothetical protein CSB13_06625 [Chloroflexota bacterium]